ncbi:MAG: restriction endonuclease subunit S [Negativicutes bacterium]
MNFWREVKLGEVVQFNPSEALAKNSLAKKIAMEKLKPFVREIDGYEMSKYSGGTKFRNGDTLLARITPCLENGKTAQVKILEENEIGFGSTEYIVLREKQNVTINDYIYYLAVSSDFREVAIKSMTGTTGRQRVQNDLLKNTVLTLPPLPEQRAIAAMLSCLDDKIELNRKINKNLEELAQAIFKRWFVDFEFPDENGQPYKSSCGAMVDSELGMIPVGWSIDKLGNRATVIDNRGKTPPFENTKTAYPIIDVKALSGNFRTINYENCTKYVNNDTYANWFRNGHPQPLDILLSTVGSLAEMKLFTGNVGGIAQNVVGLRSENLSPLYLFEYLQHIKSDLVAYNIGSVQPSIKVTHIIKHDILIPDTKVQKNFDIIAQKITSLIEYGCTQKSNLSELRDTLLPKLMSGEIRVA